MTSSLSWHRLSSLWRAGAQPFGPVLFYELVRTGRRGRFILVRCAYALVMLLALSAVSIKYGDNPLTLISPTSTIRGQPVTVWGPGRQVIVYPRADPAALRAAQAAALALFAEAFFSAFMVVQLLAVLLLTPAYTAGTIAEEKDRKRLEFLLATDLTNREIVLGKLAACLANLTLLVLTGLPIISLMQLLGGVDPALVLAGFAATGLTMLSLAALSILNSVFAQKPRDAIVLTYLAVIAYLAVSLLSLVPLQALRAPTARTWAVLRAAPPGFALPPPAPAPAPVTPPSFVAAAAVIDAFNAGNPFIALAELREAWDAGTSLTSVVPGLVGSYALFHGFVAVACTAWAISRMRLVALQAPARSKRKRRLFELRHWLRPTPGDPPMLWKEVFAEPGMTFSWFGKAIVGIIVVVSLAPALWIAGDTVQQYLSRGTYNAQELGRSINLWVRLAGTTVAVLTLLGVAFRAASSISGERDRQTLDSLLSTPLTLDSILAAKWAGSILSVRWAWAWLALIWGLAGSLGGLSAVTLPWLLLTWLAYAGFCAALGVYFSVCSPTTMRATLTTLGVLAVLFLGHALPRFFWQRGLYYNSSWLEDFQNYGLAPPLALNWLTFHGDVLYDPFIGTHRSADPWNILTSIIAGMFCWGLTGLWLWRRSCSRFRTATNRVPLWVEKAYDYTARLKAAPAPVTETVG